MCLKIPALFTQWSGSAQKQSPEVFCKKKCFLKMLQISHYNCFTITVDEIHLNLKIPTIITQLSCAVPANIYLFTVNNESIRTMNEICSKLTITIQKQRKMTSFWCLYCYLWTNFANYSVVSIVNCENVNTG